MTRIPPFEVFEIDTERQQVCVALRGDLADKLGILLAQLSNQRDPLLWKLYQHLALAADVLSGKKKIEECPLLTNVEITGNQLDNSH